MNLVPQGLTRTVSRQILHAKKNSPHILFATGVVGVVTSTVLACRATLKLEKELDEIKHDFHDVKVLKENNLPENSLLRKQYEQAYFRDLTKVYAKTAFRMGRLYGPAVVVGGASIAALTGSHIQLTRRNTALTAAFTAVSKAYEDYRERVRDEVGEERELELYRCMEDVEYEDDDGKKKKGKSSKGSHSPYARLFDETNENWLPGPDYNQFFVKSQQNYWNLKLQQRGHVFLSEVYDSLGFDRTPESIVFGWVRDGTGDQFVDFGLDDPNARIWLIGKEPGVWLDFNVDGVIYELI